MHCFLVKSVLGIDYSSRKPYFIIFLWQKWQNWVLGHLQPYISAKKTVGETMKFFESSVPVIEMVKNVLLPCHVTHGGPLLFWKTLRTLLSMAKMAKLGFGPSSALYLSQKDRWRDHEIFRVLSPCDRDGEKCPSSMSCHSWGSFTLLENATYPSFHGKNGKTGFWANFSSLSRWKRPFERQWNDSRS